MKEDKLHTDAILQLEDLRKPSKQRKNLRFSGFPEGIDRYDAIAFLHEWLTKILDKPGSRWELERAHLSPDQGRPRAFVIKLLQDAVQILAASSKKGKLLRGNPRIIFSDRSPVLHKKVMVFTLLKKSSLNFYYFHHANLLHVYTRGWFIYIRPIIFSYTIGCNCVNQIEPQ